MATNAKPVYQRILLKLSGEALQGAEGFGIDASVLDRMAQEIKELVELGIQVGVVIGGGNLFRGAGLAAAGMNRVVGDHMGMLATVMNGLAMRDALHRAYVNARLMSAFPLNGVCGNYSAACLRGIEIEADVVLKATKVDGVFSADPTKDPDAVLYEKLTYQDVLERELKVMDLAAFTLARDHNLPIRVFNMNKPGALRRVVMGESEGTLISHA